MTARLTGFPVCEAFAGESSQRRFNENKGAAAAT